MSFKLTNFKIFGTRFTSRNALGTEIERDNMTMVKRLGVPPSLLRRREVSPKRWLREQVSLSTV